MARLVKRRDSRSIIITPLFLRCNDWCFVSSRSMQWPTAPQIAQHNIKHRCQKQSEQRDAKHAEEHGNAHRSEEHTSELQSLMRISYAVFCLKKKKTKYTNT